MRKLMKRHGGAIVSPNNTITAIPPSLIFARSSSGGGCPAGIAKLMKNAGTSQFTSEGMKSAKNPAKPPIPSARPSAS